MSTTEARLGVAAALLLTRWWSQPTAEERETWDDLWDEAGAAAQSLGLGESDTDELGVAAAAADHDALLEEYERLLVGPGRVPCAPYESLWRVDAPAGEEGTLMGASAEAASAVYRRLGVDVREDAHELPDHLLLECEALAYALAHDPPVAQELLNEHLNMWVGRFCEAVLGASDEPFYCALARLTPRWLAALGE